MPKTFYVGQEGHGPYESVSLYLADRLEVVRGVPRECPKREPAG